ncbi:MAG: T9SS type A sorting domain-containing protein [bacterium]|nr:T9SS type A sorting domain-containing protein [bacterium]
MKKAFVSVIALSFTATVLAKSTPDFKQQNTNIIFTENKGQVYDQNYKTRPDVLYGAMSGNMAVHIKKNGVSYQLYRVESYKEVEDFKTKQKRKEIDKQTIYRIDINWLNANKNFTTTKDQTLPGYNNYYLESCPNGALNVKSYKGITLHNLYNGINLHYYKKNGELKHDYIVAPHMDYKQIQILVEGASVSLMDDGSLLLETPLGKVQEGAPLVFQNGKQLKARWVINNTKVSFEIENYNPEYELLIDPVTRSWGTYYGASSDDRGNACTTDAIGNVYLCGITYNGSGTIIATSGSHQSTIGPGGAGFLAKFNGTGTRLWGTYYGGNGDAAYGCCTDAGNNVYLSGGTGAASSTSLIATTGCHQPLFGGSGDAFLVKFNASGVRQWSTYYGDTGAEWGYSCATDGSNNVYMAGITASGASTMIATPGSHQSTNMSGANNYDAFLVKFNSSGVRQWGTFYGGTSLEWNSVCSADIGGNVYLAGYTASSGGTYIATPGSHQAVYGSTATCYNAYLAKFNSNGIRSWGTYYGGICSLGYGCATDLNGDVYLSGYSNATSGTIIATASSHQPTCASTFGSDAFLAKFNTNGVRQWATWYGGTGSETDGHCATDGSNNVYLTAVTASNSTTQTFAGTPGSYQYNYGGGQRDAFLVKFNSSGVRQYGTYYGGTGDEGADSPFCAADVFGDVYLSGTTSSSLTNQIATYNGHQNTYGGNPFDAFLVKFKDCALIYPLASSNTSVCSGGTINLSVTTSGTMVPLYNWSGPNSFSSNLQNPSVTNISTLQVGVYMVSIDNNGCVETNTVLVKSGDPTITVNSGSICPGKSFTINPGGASTYTYSSGSSVVSPSATISYSITGINTLGCSSTVVNTVTVRASPTISVVNGTICSGQSFTITPVGAVSYTYSSGSAIVSPGTTNSYSVIGTNSAGCVSSNTAISVVTVIQSPTVLVNNGSICVGQSFTINASGANNYSYSSGPIVTPNITSSYTVTSTNTLGCSGKAICTVTVNPIPVISVNSGAVCIGKTFNLVASGANTYVYSQGPVVSPTVTSSYSVTGSSAGCASSNTAISTVTVNPLPTVSIVTSNTLVCAGENVTLTASGASSFTFNPGGSGINSTVSPTVTSTYTVSGTDANGCVNTAVITQSVDACTGLKENDMTSSGIKLFPNPTHGIINLDLDADQEIIIINSMGQIVYCSTFSAGKHKIDIGDFAQGIYIVKPANIATSENLKIIKN